MISFLLYEIYNVGAYHQRTKRNKRNKAQFQIQKPNAFFQQFKDKTETILNEDKSMRYKGSFGKWFSISKLT